MPSGRMLRRAFSANPERARKPAINVVFSHRKRAHASILTEELSMEKANGTLARSHARTTGSRHARERGSAETVRRIHEAVVEWTKNTGKRPTAAELIATELLLTPTTHHKALSQFVTTMKSLFMHHPTEVDWTGNPSHEYVATHVILPQTSQSILESVEGAIHFNPKKVVSTDEIVAQLNLSKKQTGALDAALQILEKARYIECVSRGRNGKSSRYRWKRYGAEIEPHEIGGPRYQLLERLANGKIGMRDLVARGGIKPRATTDIYEILRILVKNQLIQFEREKNPRGRPKIFVSFTKKGNDLWEQHVRTKQMPRAFRDVLFTRFYAGRNGHAKKN